ncbi:MAG: glycosyltransferase family 1 protein [Alphaproteobacteria bacterium]|nr:glycosyltransferase family 1 protein [Alphaproteobacteria bacterium]
MICYLSNAAPHYRRAIFERINREFDCHFYIGDRVAGIGAYMDFRSLKGFRAEVHNVKLAGSLYWQRRVLRLAFSSYERFLIDGEPICLSTWLLLLILRLRGRPAVVWSHGWYGDEGLVKRSLKKIFFHLAATTLLYGDHARNLMISRGFDPRKLICIYNSLDYDRMVGLRELMAATPCEPSGYHKPAIPAEPGAENPKANAVPTAKTRYYAAHFGNNDPVILFIGRIQPSKKTALLIEAWRRLNQEGHPCNLVLIGGQVAANKNVSDDLTKQYGYGGDGNRGHTDPLQSVSSTVLQSQSSQSPGSDVLETDMDSGSGTLFPEIPEALKERLWLTGPLYDEARLAPLIYHAGVCVSPGNVGLAAIHCLTYGLPVITHDNPARQGPEFEAITPGVTGDFFREDDPEDLYRVIKRWISLSPEQREKVRGKCYKTIEARYTPQYQISVLKEVMNRQTN